MIIYNKVETNKNEDIKEEIILNTDMIIKIFEMSNIREFDLLTISKYYYNIYIRNYVRIGVDRKMLVNKGNKVLRRVREVINILIKNEGYSILQKDKVGILYSINYENWYYIESINLIFKNVKIVELHYLPYNIMDYVEEIKIIRGKLDKSLNSCDYNLDFSLIYHQRTNIITEVVIKIYNRKKRYSKSIIVNIIELFKYF